MRSSVFLLLVLGCGHVAPLDHDAAASPDSSTPRDSSAPSSTPTFVQHFYGDGGSQQQYKAPTPGSGPGRLLVMIITYNSLVINVQSVIDDPGVSLQRAFEPLKWTSGGYNWQTEVWWGTRNLNNTTTTVTFTGAPPGFSYFYGSEFIATSIDQVAAATGMLTTAGTFSTGSRTTAFSNELVFGHGEGEGAELSPGAGFTLRRGGGPGGAGVLEQTKSADVPGTYEVPFSMDRSGHWLAVMLTLR